MNEKETIKTNNITENTVKENDKKIRLDENKKNKNFIKNNIILMIVILLVISFFIISNSTNPKNIIKGNLQKAFDILYMDTNSNSSKFLTTLLAKTNYIDSNLTLSTTSLDTPQELNLKLAGNLNIKDNFAFMRFILTNNDYTIFDGLSNIKDNNLYINDYVVTNNKYINFIQDNDILNTSIDSNYVTYYNNVIRILNNTVLNNITEECITKQKDTISINGKDKTVNKVSLNISSSKYVEITTNIINNLKSSDDFYKLLTTLYNLDKKDIDKVLNDTLKRINTIKKSDNNILQLNIYTDLFKFVKLNIKSYNDDTQNLNTILSLTSSPKKDYDYVLKYYSTTSENEFDTYSAYITYLDDKSYSVKIYLADKNIYNLDFKYTDDILNLNVSNNDLKLNMLFNQKSDSTLTTINLDFKNIINLNLNHTLTLTNENTSFKPENIQLESVKEYNNLTDEELTKLSTILQQTIMKSPLMKSISNLNPSLLSNFINN